MRQQINQMIHSNEKTYLCSAQVKSPVASIDSLRVGTGPNTNLDGGKYSNISSTSLFHPLDSSRWMEIGAESATAFDAEGGGTGTVDLRPPAEVARLRAGQ